MKHIKSAMALCLAAALACPMPVFAQIPEGYDEQRWQRLNDNHIEYDEIEDLIINFSPAYVAVAQEMAMSYAPIEDAISQLDGDIKDKRRDVDDAKNDASMWIDPLEEKPINPKTDPLPDEFVDIATDYGTAKGTKKSLEKTLKTIKGGSGRTLNTTVKGGLVTGTQSLMVNYQRVNAAIELVDASVNLAEASYNSTVTQHSLGLKTADDVVAAQESLLSARVKQQDTRNQAEQLKQNICMLTGWQYNSEVVIGAVPAPDPGRITAMDLESDTDKAIGNNYTLSEMRHQSSSGKKVAEKRSRLDQMEETEDKIRVAVNQHYQTVLKSQTAYQAASAAYESASITYGSNQRQHQLGMISSLQFQQLTVVYLSEKMNYENAKLDFFQAMEDYDWAVKGNLSLE